jgi:hypothetical protein
VCVYVCVCVCVEMALSSVGETARKKVIKYKSVTTRGAC